MFHCINFIIFGIRTSRSEVEVAWFVGVGLSRRGRPIKLDAVRQGINRSEYVEAPPPFRCEMLLLLVLADALLLPPCGVRTSCASDALIGRPAALLDAPSTEGPRFMRWSPALLDASRVESAFSSKPFMLLSRINASQRNSRTPEGCPSTIPSDTHRPSSWCLYAIPNSRLWKSNPPEGTR